LHDINKINWKAVQEAYWSKPKIKEKKQAEFLKEQRFPWKLLEQIGVYSNRQLQQVRGILNKQKKIPIIKIQPSWYY